jgi:hypothetical protein
MRTSLGTLALAFIFATSTAQSPSQPFSLTIAGPNTIKAGAPIFIQVALKNTSGHPVDVIVHLPVEFDYVTEVLDSKGEPAKYTGRGHFIATHKCDSHDVDPTAGMLSCRNGELEAPRMIAVQPNDKKVGWFEVSEQFRMGEPGEYSIQVSRSPAGDSQTVVHSNKITVTVTP